MTKTDIFETLTRRLQNADDKTLLKIVGVVDQLAKRGAVDQLLDQHRVRLAVIRPPRPMTIARVLVAPLEGLLIDGEGWTPSLMRIPRDRLTRLIALVTERLPPGLEQTLTERLARSTMDDAAVMLEVGRELWPSCADILQQIIDQHRQSRDPAARELLLPLKIARLLMPVAEAVVTTVWSLPPKPVLAIDQATRDRIVALLGVASAEGRDCFQLVADLLINRTELPFSIIEPIIDGTVPLGQRERQQAAAMIAEACQSDMIRLHRSLAALPEAAEPSALVAGVQTLVSTIASLQEVAAGVKFDHRALRRLKTDVFDLVQARLSRSLQQDLLRALEELSASTPMSDWRRLEQNAAAIANLRLMAKRVGLSTKIDFVFNKALEQYRSLVMARIQRGSSCGAEKMPLLDALSMDRLRIIELLFGSLAALQMLTTLRRSMAAPA